MSDFPLPKPWLDALVEVQHYAPFDPVVIAGGALRDLYQSSSGLLADMGVKDLDIFIMGAPDDMLLRRFGEPQTERGCPTDSAASSVNPDVEPAWRWPELEIEGVKVDLVALGTVESVDQLLQGFDINLCKVARDGNYATLHHDFINCAQREIIAAVAHHWPERTNERIDRLR